MNPLREQLTFVFQVAVLLTIWAILLLVKGVSLQIDWEAMKLLPDAVGIYAGLLWGFVKWGWRWVVFRGWLVTTPNLNGTWVGHLQTTWKNPETGEIPCPLEMYLVIRQSFLRVHITMFTKESVSQSDAAALSIDDERGQRLLSYSYANVPEASVRHRSQIHYGAARLAISMTPARQLQGEYWTDRKSTGHMRFVFLSKKLIEHFPVDTVRDM